jgi:hypothetical protein
MPSFAQALKRDINRLKFREDVEKAAPKRKPKKEIRREDEGILRTRDIKVLIGQAATRLLQIEMTYKKETTGEVKKYRVAPYSYRYRHLRTGIRKMFFAYDMDDRHIKGFVLRNIRKVDILKRRYSPKWPVEIAVPVTIYG